MLEGSRPVKEINVSAKGTKGEKKIVWLKLGKDELGFLIGTNYRKEQQQKKYFLN